jgi:hypothetical protein
VANRVNIAGGVLVLPTVAYYGAPVILNVPGLGYVDVPEDEYARLYEKLSSSDAEQIRSAMESLRAMKAAEDLEVEASQRRPADLPIDAIEAGGDLSERLSFDGPSRSRVRRNAEPSRRLY